MVKSEALKNVSKLIKTARCHAQLLESSLEDEAVEFSNLSLIVNKTKVEESWPSTQDIANQENASEFDEHLMENSQERVDYPSDENNDSFSQSNNAHASSEYPFMLPTTSDCQSYPPEQYMNTSKAIFSNEDQFIK